jgi:molybdenum cofactor cytidylyltransferase
VNGVPIEGLSRSLRLGLRAVPPGINAAVILLGDQPTLEAAAIGAVLGGRRHGRPVVAARAGGRFGPPVLLTRDAFWLADEAGGDAGLGPVLARHPDLVAAAEVDHHPPDVDTPSDLARLQ